MVRRPRPASSTRASPRSSAAQHLADLSDGKVVATFDVDALHDYRARRPPMTFVRDHYADYEAPRLVVRAHARHRRYAVPAPRRPRARHPVGGLRPRGPRGRRALRRDPGRQHGRRADGGAAHPADRASPPREPPRPAPRREPVARRAAHPGERPGAAGDPAGGVGPSTRWASSPTSRTTSRRWSTRRPRSCCSSTSRSAAASPSTSAELREAAEITRGRDRPLPLDQRRGRRRRPRRSSSSTTPSARPRPAAPRLLAGDQPLPTGEEIGQHVRAVPGRPRRTRGRPGQRRRRRRLGRPLMAGSADELADLLDLERLDVDLFRGAQAPTPSASGSSAARSPRRRWSPRPAPSRPSSSLHSLHSYFLRPGDTTVPIVYDVERIRDGRSFATRRVSARQHGRPIYYMTANFQIPEPGLEHQDRMPEVPAPEQGMPLVELARSRGPEAAGHVGAGVGGARHPARRRSPARGSPRTPSSRPGPGCGSRSTASSRADPHGPAGGVHLRQRPHACWAPPWCRTASTSPRRGSSRRRSTTRSGSTGPSAPTSGGSTTSSRRSPAAAAASPWPGCSPQVGRARGDGGPGGPDPAPRRPLTSCSSGPATRGLRPGSSDRAGAASRPSGWSSRRSSPRRPGGRRSGPCSAGGPAS